MDNHISDHHNENITLDKKRKDKSTTAKACDQNDNIILQPQVVFLADASQKHTNASPCTSVNRRRHTASILPLNISLFPRHGASDRKSGSESPSSPSLSVRKRRKTGDTPVPVLHSAVDIPFPHEKTPEVPNNQRLHHVRSHSITDLRSESLRRTGSIRSLRTSSTADSSFESLPSIPSPERIRASFSLDAFPPGYSTGLSGTFDHAVASVRDSIASTALHPRNSRILEPSDVLTWNAVQHDGPGPAASTFESPPQSPCGSNSRPQNVASSFPKGQDEQSDSQNALLSGSHSSSIRHSVISEGFGSLWDYFLGELFGADFDESPDVKKERVQNFLSVPSELEKLMFFGFMICLDSFLHIFTILPLRIVIALGTMIKSIGSSTVYLKSAQKCDLMKGALIVICCYMLQHYDASQIYHSVRGQALIKLYVIFNSLEICDKLCSAFGHDILDSLFSKTTVKYTLANPNGGQRQFGRVKHFLVALCYVFTHSIVLFYQVMTLNVSVNSYNNALLTLLLSNQFVEIKGSVFKRFERENLFQLSCADIVERFQLSVFLCIITLRNLIELTGGLSDLESAFSYFYSLSASMFAPSNIIQTTLSIPSASSLLFGLKYVLSTPTYKLFETLATPVIVVFGTEVMVDWLKHAFICKFNYIKPEVYGRFKDSLCRDLVGLRAGGEAKEKGAGEVPGGREKRMMFLDQSPAVARRIGFVSIPLSCLVIRVSIQTLQMLMYLRDNGDDNTLNANGDDILESLWKVGKAFINAWNASHFPRPSQWFTKEGLEGCMNALMSLVKVCLDQDVQSEVINVLYTCGIWVMVVGMVYLCLLSLKLIIGMSMHRAARRRALELDNARRASSLQHLRNPSSDDIHQSHHKHHDTERATEKSGVTKPPDAQETTVQATAISDKLDRVDRFTMMKSRIV